MNGPFIGSEALAAGVVTRHALRRGYIDEIYVIDGMIRGAKFGASAVSGPAKSKVAVWSLAPPLATVGAVTALVALAVLCQARLPRVSGRRAETDAFSGARCRYRAAIHSGIPGP